jgi:hypothetical protein
MMSVVKQWLPVTVVRARCTGFRRKWTSSILTFILWSFDLSVAADSQSYFRFWMLLPSAFFLKTCLGVLSVWLKKITIL